MMRETSGRNMLPSSYDASLEEGQPPFEEKGLPASEVTIAEVLKEQGYYTAHIGKWHLGRKGGMAPHEQGFDDSLLMTSGLYLPEKDPNVVNAKIPTSLVDRFIWAGMTFANSFNSGDENQFKPAKYLTDYYTDEAINVIKANKNRHFFLYLAHWGVHNPLQATKEDYDAVGDIKPHRKRVYAAMIRALDRSVGRIQDTLKEQGLDKNTLIIFTSDNGGAGYIDIPEVNEPFRGFKVTMFEGGIRVPTVMKWPAEIDAGQTANQPVAHIDIFPTMAAAANVDPSSDIEIDGVSLLPLSKGDGGKNWSRKTLFWQNGHYQVVRHIDWKLQVNDRITDGRQYWLYNLADDPTEQNNLAESHPEKLDELKKLLTAHQATSRGPLYPAAANWPQLIDKTQAEEYEVGDEYVYTPN